jgi:hypothetical protein
MAVQDESTADQVSTDDAGATDQASGATAQTETPAQKQATATNGSVASPAADTTDETETIDPAAFKKLQSDLTKLNKELEKTRKEAASRRVEGQDKEKALKDLRDQVAKSLGLEVEDQAADPKQLAAQIDELKGKYRAERLKGAFERVARNADVDVELALALMTLKGDLADLDLDDSGLEAELKERIESAKERNPRISLNTQAAKPAEEKKKKEAPAPVVAANAAEITGGGDPPLTRAMIAKMTPDEVNQNFERITKALAAGTLK